MRKIALLIAPLLLVGWGCSSQQGQKAAEKAPEEATQAVDTAAHHAREGVAEGEVVTVSGTLGCGHCTYETAHSCVAAIQTTDGVVYILDTVPEKSELFEKRYDRGEVTVVGVPSEQDGANHIAVTSYQM